MNGLPACAYCQGIEGMCEQDPDNLQWVANWRKASIHMDQLQMQELAHIDTARAIEALDDAYESARQHSEPSKTSGLVIQQAWFMKGRR